MGPVLVEWRIRLVEQRYKREWRHDTEFFEKDFEYTETSAARAVERYFEEIRKGVCAEFKALFQKARIASQD